MSHESHERITPSLKHLAVAPLGLLLCAFVSLVPGCATAPLEAIPAENARVAFQSQCIQNVITCTSSFPTAVINLQSVHGQIITPTATGFIVQQPGGAGPYNVQLIGSGSSLGNNASMLTYSWTSGASDSDPCSLAPGEEFSTRADPLVRLAPGLHYIRLTVTNNNILPRLESPECGLLGENVPAFDFLEIELDIRR